MAALTEDQAAALLGFVMKIYTRQIAILKLARSIESIPVDQW